MYKIVECFDKEENPRKRMCLNCRHRKIDGAGDYCTYNGERRFLHYGEVFDGWCRHWSKIKTTKE